MSYREHAPSPALATWLACTWERTGDGGPAVRVLPDGCIDLVWIEGTGTLVVGANTAAFRVDLPAGMRTVGARLRPGAAPALLGVAAEGIRDARVAVSELWDDDGERLAAELDAADDPVDALQAALLRLAATAPEPDPLVRQAVDRLSPREVALACLADDLGVSERQLRRRVRAAVGYGPKRLSRVLRLQRALAGTRAGVDLAQVALDAGYADQSHFSHDCRALAGVPPSAL